MNLFNMLQETMTTDSHYTVIIVGAGRAGLPAAKTYLELEPDVSLLIIDGNRSIGGVWAKEKIYPDLRLNNLRGTFEYSDFPMHDGFGVKKGEHIPGEVAHEYFRLYAERFDLTRRILLESKVRSAEKVQKGWRLLVVPAGTNTGSEGGETRAITCDKLMIATGLTDLPAPIDILGSENFNVPLINFGSLAQEAPGLLEDLSIKHVTVQGTGKSAYDSVHLFASSGKRVTWIMRASGHGPCFMAPAYMRLGPFLCWLEALTTTRFFTWFSPCIWGNADGFGYVRSLLHGTRVGRWIVDKFWKKLSADTIEQAGLNKNEKLKILIPDVEAFWVSARLGILNYPSNIYDYVTNGQVEVLRKDVECLENGNSIKFTDGHHVETDALICSTGWNFSPDIEFLPRSLHSEFGIPSLELTKSQKEMWAKLNAKVDVEICERFPKLTERPLLNDHSLVVRENLPLPSAQRKHEEYSPWRLWRGVVPPLVKEKNLVFLGMMHNFQGSLTSEITALWAYAYMKGDLSRSLRMSTEKQYIAWDGASKETAQKTEEEEEEEEKSILYETALFNQFTFWRGPYGMGARHPDFVFDIIPFFDLLLQDLGLNSWRKGWGWVGEVFGGAYMAADYRGLIDEWKMKRLREGASEGQA